MIKNSIFDLEVDCNRYSNLDSLEWRLVNHLLNSSTYSAETIWKLLYYATEDCLLQNNITREQKISLIHKNTGEETGKRVFVTPYIDDAWKEQTSHIHIFVDSVFPENLGISNINVSFEALTHAKIGTILGESTGENQVGLTEYDKDGTPLILYKSRSTTLLKHLLAEFNCLNVEGVGLLQFNQKLNPYNVANQYLWNNRAYYGYSFKMGVKISGVSVNNEGY